MKCAHAGFAGGRQLTSLNGSAGVRFPGRHKSGPDRRAKNLKAMKVKIYNAIAQAPGIDAVDLAMKIGVRADEIYDALHGLIITGLVVRQHLGGVRYGYFVAPK